MRLSPIFNGWVSACRAFSLAAGVGAAALASAATDTQTADFNTSDGHTTGGYTTHAETSDNSFTWDAGFGAGATGGLKATVTGSRTDRRSSVVRKIASSASGTVETWETSLDFRVGNIPATNNSARSAELWLGLTTRTNTPSTSSDSAHKYLSDENGGIMVYVSASHATSGGGTSSLSLRIRNNTSNVGSAESVAASNLADWLRIKLSIVRGSGNSYTVAYQLYNLGADGAAEPVLVTESTGNAVTNSNMGGGATTYAAFAVATRTNSNVTPKTELSVDNHLVSVTTATPQAPVALTVDEASITTTRLTARWQAPAAGLSPTGYVLELVKTGDAFEAGNFIAAGGAPEQATGITLSSGTTSQAFTGLERNQSYSYRVFAANAAGSGPASNVVTVSTANANTEPTLDPIAAPAPRAPGNSTPASLALTGISTGGDDDQTLVVTAVSSNPAIVPHPTVSLVAPSPLAGGFTTGTLDYAPTGEAGTATITVTVTDRTGETVEGGVSETFIVRVQPPVVTHGFDTAAELEQYGQANSAASIITAHGWNATAGKDGSGGISITKTGSSHGYANGWRQQPLDLRDKSLITTSILVNLKDLNLHNSNASGVYLGFVNNSGDPDGAPSVGTSSFLLTGGTGNNYRAISAYLSLIGNGGGTLSLQLYNKNGTGNATAILSPAVTQTGATSLKENWFLLTLTLTPTGAVGEYTAAATVEDLGLDGTATPTGALLSTGDQTLTNETIYATAQGYPAYNVYFYNNSSTTGTIRLDDHTAQVTVSVPGAPATTAATDVTTTNFTANWTPAASGPGATGGFVLEIIPAAGDFATGPFVQADGTTAATGIAVADPAAVSLDIGGLTLGASYRYRVRALNAYGSSPVSNVTDVTISSVNIPPTIDPLPAQPLIHAGETAPLAIVLTGITHGGDVGQTITVTPSVIEGGETAIIQDVSIAYTTPAATGTLTYIPTGEPGTATLRVTVSDGVESVHEDVTITVNVVPAQQSFDDAAGYAAHYSSAVYRGAVAHGSAYGRAVSAEDSTATGGLRVDVATSDNGYVSGWRNQPYNLSDKTYIQTSILIKPSGWVEKDQRERFYLGFAHNNAGVANDSTLLYSGTATGIAAYLSCNFESSSGPLYFGLANKAAGSTVSTSQVETISNRRAYRDNWHRITLVLSPLGSGQFAAVATLEDLGANGTSEPVLLSTREATLTNATLASSFNAYAAYTSYSSKSDTGYIYLDDHEVELSRDEPNAPVALEADSITTTNFTAHWAPAPGPGATLGYTLRVIPAGGDFSDGPFLQPDGTLGDDPVEIASSAARSQVFTGLTTRGAAYQYRVRAINSAGQSEPSNVVEVQTADENLPPTLGPIAAQIARYPGDTTSRDVALTGITHGGDVGQTITVTATSDNQDVLPDGNISIDYATPTATGTLTYTPTGAAGVATVTVKVSDGEDEVTRAFTVRLQAPPEFLGFDDEADLDEYASSGTSNLSASGWAPGVGTGSPAGGALVVQRSSTSSSGNHTGWRTQPLNFEGKTYLYTSIDFQGSAWNDSNDVHVGFVTNADTADGAPAAGITANPMHSGSAYRGISVYMDYSWSNNRFTLALRNKASNSSSSSTLSLSGSSSASVSPVNDTHRQNWLRLSLTLVPNGTANGYNVFTTLEDLGPDGASEPSVIAHADSTAVNAAIYASAKMYAAYSVDVDSSNTGITRLDNHDVVLSAGTPEPPTALAPAGITTTNLTARWQRAATGGYPTAGFVVELTKASDNFAENTFIGKTGATGQAAGVTVTGAASSALVFTGLERGVAYVYRVRAGNSEGNSEPSNVIATGTSATNIPPTLDPIAAQPGLYPANSAYAPVTVALTGITHGGDANQTLTVTATSSHPSVVPHPVVSYTSGNQTGSLAYTATGVQGTATITVTVTDSGDGANSVSRTFTVRVQPPPEEVGFDTPAALDDFAGATTSNLAYAWGAAAGAGSPTPSGGLLVQRTSTSSSATYNGWRTQPLDLTEKNFISTSILFNGSAWTNSADIYLGFAVNTARADRAPAPGDTNLFLVSSSSADYRAIGVYLDYSNSNNRFTLALRNKTGTGGASTPSVTGTPSVSPVSATHRQNWLRLNLTLIPSGAVNTYDAITTLEDLGPDGTAAPVIIASASAAITNEAIFTATRAYPAYHVYLDSSNTGATRLDDHEAVASSEVPHAPVAQAATVVTREAFIAHWTRPPASAVDGYLLELIRKDETYDPENPDASFVPGKLLKEDGEIATDEDFLGVEIDPTDYSQRLEGLASSTAYLYRVRAVNSAGAGPASAVIEVTTLHATGNLPPTLDAIVSPTHALTPGRTYTLALTGITDGGETNQDMTVTAVSTDDAIVVPSVLYAPNETTGTLQLAIGETTGPATITVTVTDGPEGQENRSVTRTFTVNVREPLAHVAFDDAEAFAEYTRSHSTSGIASSWGEAHGIGSPAGGGVRIQATSKDKVAAGWLSQPYSLAGATSVRTSILVNLKNATSKTYFGIGFTTAAPGSVTNDKFLIDEYEGSHIGMGVSLRLEDGSKLGKRRIVNKASASKASKLLDNDTTITGVQSNWLRLSLIITPTGASTGTARYLLENLGPYGVSAPTVVYQSAEIAFTNAALLTSQAIYAAYNISIEDAAGSAYLDDHKVEVLMSAPPAPVAGEPTIVTSNAFTVNWTPPANTYYTGTRVEVSTSPEFAENTLVSTTGATGQAEGVLVAGTSARSLRFTGLTPSTSYYYRVFTLSPAGASEASNTVAVATLGEGENAPPTLNPVAFGLTRVAPGSGPYAVNLSGITDGGEGGQTLQVSVVSDNPAIADAVVSAYTSPATTGQLQIISGTETGTATITVTVSDNQAQNPTISRTFTVTVGPAPLAVGFDTNEDYLSEFSTAASNSSRAATWNPSAGKDGSGGLSIYYNKDDENTRYVSGWRKEPYTAAGAGRLATSILIKPSGWGDKDHRESFHLGFAHNAPGVPNTNSLLISGTAAAMGATLSYDEKNSPYLYFALSNKAAGATASSALGRVSVPNGSSLQNNWLRLSVEYLPSATADAYDVTATLEDLGSGGTSAPVLLRTLQQTLTNATLFNSTNTYAGYTHYLTNKAEKKTGYTYLDDHTASVEHGPPLPPVAEPPSLVVSRGFIASWRPNEEPSGFGAFLLEVSTSNTFTTLLDEHGQTTLTPIVVEGRGERGLRITGLTPATTYYYRVSTTNGTEHSAPSNVVSVTTLGANANLLPTLDAIIAPAKVRMNAAQQVVALTGITDGGEADQTLTVTATSSDTAIIPDPVVVYESPSSTGTLRFTPAPEATGEVTITVRVSDSGSAPNYVERTFTVLVYANVTYITAGDGTYGSGAKGAAWKYLDNGSDPGSGWKDAAYDDSEWKSGRSALGYGLSVATALSYGGNANAKHPVSHFRHRFEVENPGGIRGLTLRMKVDDGAVVYLNGTEIARTTANMPAGPIGYQTLATGNGDGGAAWKTYTVDPARLVPGDNILAASVHLASASASALYLDLDLVSEEILAPLDEALIEALPATHVTSASFNARWADPADYVVGYVLEVSKAADNFAEGTLINEWGQGGQTTGIVVPGVTSLHQRIEGLQPSTAYVYRVRALNAPPTETEPNVITVTTLAIGQNAAPTLDPIADRTLPINAPQQTVQLTGISDGGEDYGQYLTVTATSSNTALIPTPTVLYDREDLAEIGQLRFTPVAGQHGTAVISVTVNDHQSNNNLTTRTFTVTVTDPTPPGPTYASWKSEFFPGYENDTLVSGPLVDVDGDGLPNLLEYALGLDPTLSDRAGAVTLGRTVGDEYLTLTFTRIADPALTYVVEATNDLASGVWTPVFTSTGAQNVEGVVTAEDTERIADHPRRFLRLVVMEGESNVAEDAPRGFQRVELPAGTSSLGLPLLNEAVVTVRVESVAGDVLTLAGGSSLNVGVLLSPESAYPFYLEVIAGPLEGERLDINVAATITAANNTVILSSDYTRNTLPADRFSELAGNAIAVRRHITLTQMQGWFDSELAGSNDSSAADSVYFFSNTGFAQYYLRGNKLAWRDTILTTDQRHKPVESGTGVLVQLSDPNTLIQFGTVRGNAFVRSLASGAQFVANGYPVDFSLLGIGAVVDSGRPPAADWVGDNDPQLADSVYIFGDTGFAQFYLRNNGTTWRDVFTTTNHASSLMLKADKAYLIGRQNAGSLNYEIQP